MSHFWFWPCRCLAAEMWFRDEVHNMISIFTAALEEVQRVALSVYSYNCVISPILRPSWCCRPMWEIAARHCPSIAPKWCNCSLENWRKSEIQLSSLKPFPSLGWLTSEVSRLSCNFGYLFPTLPTVHKISQIGLHPEVKSVRRSILIPLGSTLAISIPISAPNLSHAFYT